MKIAQQLNLFKETLKAAVSEVKAGGAVSNPHDIAEQAKQLGIPFSGCTREGLDIMLNVTKHKLLERLKDIESHHRAMAV